uniref:Kazal-like domain-containing protein n=1 Tax=Clastoptera arizonana TaxID=38151 RepID=A0A1B6CRM0_9HEMI
MIPNLLIFIINLGVGVLAQKLNFGHSEMLACGGNCDNDQYLVCARKGDDSPITFPNHCYLDVANNCFNQSEPYRPYLEREDHECNFHKDYVYFEVLDKHIVI